MQQEVSLPSQNITRALHYAKVGEQTFSNPFTDHLLITAMENTKILLSYTTGYGKLSQTINASYIHNPPPTKNKHQDITPFFSQKILTYHSHRGCLMFVPAFSHHNVYY